uniref:F-box domain-containing protein n=1 Tax=Strongyloides venezuelensis TaxID=75913 RepID=A0A0K0EWA6_STRVS
MFSRMRCKELTTKKDTPSLTSLPSEILLIIFTNLDWRSLEILKLTSKRLYNLIEYTYLPTKFVKELELRSYSTVDNSLRISFAIKTNKHQIEINDIPFYIKEKYPHIDKIERILEKYCLRSVPKINIHVKDDSIVFDLLNRYFQYDTEVECLKIFIEKSPVFKSFSRFMDKMKYVECLIIECLCFNNQKISSNYTFSIEKDLKKLIINECRCCAFVNQKMIMQLFENNPNIKLVKMNSNSDDIDKLIINYVTSRPDKEDNGKCHHPLFKLYLPFNEERIVKSEFNRLFSSKSYIYQDYKNKESYNTSTFGALKICSNGCHFKEIVIDCSEIFYNQLYEDEFSLYEHFIVDNIYEIFLVSIIFLIIVLLFFIVLIIRFLITL